MLPPFQTKLQVWGVLLAAVLPLWREPALAARHPRLVQNLAMVLRNCTENAATMHAAATAGRTQARAPGPVDPGRVATLQEMGFTAAAAEEALRRVGNRLELAMEWLIAHPDAGQGAPPPAGASAAEDEALAAMVAAALSMACAGAPLAGAPTAEGGEPTPAAAPAPPFPEPPSASMPDSGALADDAVALARAAPSCAFPLADLLRSHAALGSQQRSAVVQRLLWHLSRTAEPSDAQLLAPCHLLAVLLGEASSSREVAAEKGEQASAAQRARALCLASPHVACPQPCHPATPHRLRLCGSRRHWRLGLCTPWPLLHTP